MMFVVDVWSILLELSKRRYQGLNRLMWISRVAVDFFKL